MRVFAAALLTAAAAAGCAPIHPALFAVVPGSDGHVGRIVVRDDWWDKRVIDTAYGAQRVTETGALETVTLTPAEVEAAFGPTLAALPGKPATFTLYFLEGSDELTAESAAQLDEVMAELRRRPLPDIAVIGHTDTVGGTEYNDRLSLARAERMRETLVALGIPAQRVSAAGRGKRELLVPTEDNTQEPRNRRVEINVR